MIRSFRGKGLERFAAKGDRSRLSVPNVQRLERILAALDVATAPEQMDVPGWRFHPLKGNRKGTFSVDASWRVTFRFDGPDAVDVDLEDYH
jgi:proteic killer suppression protein